MEKEVYLINKVNGLSCFMETFAKGEGILLTDFEDEQPQGEFNKFKGVNQHGQSITSSSLSERLINVNGVIIANNRKQIEVLKRELVKVVNPLNDVLLKYKEAYIEKEIIVRPESIPKFPSDFRNSKERVQVFSCFFSAPYPFWQDQEETVTNIETWEGGIEFPLEVPNDGIEFARKGPNELEFLNYGDIESPLEIFFNGPALNPIIKLNNDKINNENKEVFIKLNRQIQETEVLYISTMYGNKRVEIIKSDGTRENAYNYIDTKSTVTLFNLEVGSNILSYNTDGDFIPQSVIIKYKNKYLSL